jgi:solute carrier family 24 (sodium/potassium/calcium exchanger), member 6
LISVPSIFILVITLPVVETEDQDDGNETSVADPPGPPGPGQLGNIAWPVSIGDNTGIQPETEWQEYRRRAQSISSRPSLSHAPSLISLNIPQPPGDQVSSQAGTRPPVGAQVPQSVKSAPSLDPDCTTTSTEVSMGWNRWLVAVQLFAGPLFVVFIVWANTYEDSTQPGKLLLRLVLYALLFSLCLLVVLLLTTSPDEKPKYHSLLCFLGFVISVAWISTIAGEVVGVLKAFGVILGISEAILGLTIFAVGNSLGDLVADVTVARLGYPVMAL